MGKERMVFPFLRSSGDRELVPARLPRPCSPSPPQYMALLQPDYSVNDYSEAGPDYWGLGGIHRLVVGPER